MDLRGTGNSPNKCLPACACVPHPYRARHCVDVSPDRHAHVVTARQVKGLQRFYDQVDVVPSSETKGSFDVTLDGRVLRSPLRQAFNVRVSELPMPYMCGHKAPCRTST